MRISVGGPSSEIEAEALKKLITEKELKQILSSKDSNKKDFERTKTKLRDLISFYDRIIKSIQTTIATVNSKTQLSYKQKNDLYLKNQEKELAQAKRERSKFRRYLQQLNERINDSK